MWCAMSEYDNANRTRTNKKTTCTFTSIVEFHVLCVGLGFHVVIGVERVTVRFHHAYAIPSFLLDIVVQLCPVIVNSDCSPNSCILHIAKAGPLRCCPYKTFTGCRACNFSNPVVCEQHFCWAWPPSRRRCSDLRPWRVNVTRSVHRAQVKLKLTQAHFT